MAKRPASEAFHVEKELRKKEGKKHSLDSDEEDSGAEEEKTNVLHADDIEGEEDGVAGMEGEITITPFNMKEELEEGHFDNQGHYHWKKEKEIRDGWLDNIDWVKVKGRPEDKYKIHKDDENKGLGDESSSEDEQPEEKFVLLDNYKEIIQHMKPKETIAKTLQRLGTSTSRPSYNQLEMLVEFLEKNPGIAKGLLRTHQAKLETKRKWANLATSLNALGGASKDGQGWAKYWAEKKCSLKKQCANLSASIRSTGGGTPINLPTLSTLDNRLVAILGGQDIAMCDTRLNVDPLAESTGPIIVKIEKVNPVLEDALIQSTAVSPTPGTSRDDTETITQATPTPLQSTKRRNRLRRSSIQNPVDTQMERFARIEERRVEAEVITAQALNRLTESVQHMTNSFETIAEAIKEMARKMP